MLYATDKLALGDVRVSDAGYLEAFARAVRTGVQQYLGAELERPDLAVVNVYRDAAEVFSHDTLHSFAQVPITVGHPPGGVNARNWRQVARGTSGAEVLRDGEFMRIGVKVKDAAAIKDVQDGICQLSAGYRCRIVWGDGVAPDGTPYQAKQVGIVADHIAIVPAGRAGPACRIGDSWAALDAGEGAAREPVAPQPPTPPNHLHRDATPMKTLMIDGHSVGLDDAAFIAVSALQKQLGTAVADVLAKDAALSKANTDHAAVVRAKDEAAAKLVSDHAGALTAKDGEILKLQADHKVALDAKDAEIAKLKSEALTADKMDAAIAERAAVLEAAKPVLGVTFDAKGKTVADIRRAAVAKRLGDAAVAGKADEHVTIAFDTLTLAGGAKVDPLAAAVTAQVSDAAGGDPRAAAYKAMNDGLTTAWQPKAA